MHGTFGTSYDRSSRDFRRNFSALVNFAMFANICEGGDTAVGPLVASGAVIVMRACRGGCWVFVSKASTCVLTASANLADE